jgi:hypothetical protein
MTKFGDESNLVSVCSPLFVTLKDGLQRLCDAINSEEFVFIVKDGELKSTVAEAALISSKVHENLRFAPGNHRFQIEDENVTLNAFIRFLDFIHSPVCDRFSESEQTSFLLICKYLGNEGLTFLLLDSLNVSKDFDFSSFDSDRCASHFHEYSVDLIRVINKNTLHGILSSTKLKVESEDHLLKTLIDLGSAYFEYWCYIEVILLSSEGISLFVEHLQFEALSESIWMKIVDRLRVSEVVDFNGKSTLVPQRYIGLVEIDTIIMRDYPNILKDFERKNWTLLYRGSRDGFRASNFHEKCDNQTNTLTLIETTKGFIFGGFTPIAWESASGIFKLDSSGKSFLFSLKNPRNSEPRKFMLMSGKNAICCNSSYGPWFPSNNDMVVYDNCDNTTNNFTNLGGSYMNDTGIDGRLVFTGEYNFTVKEIEVFTISL